MSSSIPVRLPRSLQESPTYKPDFRFHQVEEYLRCRRRASETGETFVVPLTERDAWVRSYWKFRTDTPTPRAAVCRYAQDLFDTNDRTWMASRIRAMTVAGLSTAEIAGRLHTLSENIEAFQKLFFDVAAYVADRAVMGAILAPLTEANMATDPRDRVWLIAALKLGVKGLDYVMDQRVKLSAVEQSEIGETIHAVLAQKTLAYSLSLQSRPEAGAEAMQAYQKSQEMRLRNPVKDDDEKSAIFWGSLLRITKERLAAQGAAHGGGNKPIQAAA